MPPAPTPSGNFNINETGFTDAQQQAVATAEATAPKGVTYTNTGVSPSSQSLLVTSGTARAAHAANVTKLQQITQPPAGTDTGTGTGAGAPPDTSGTKTGTDTSDNRGTETSSSTADPYASAVAGITDPGTAAQYKSSLQSLDEQVSQAKSNLAGAQSLAANDPAASAAISAISAKYEQAIQLMKARNTQLIGRANASVGAFGGLGPMSQDFLNNEQSLADERVMNYVNNEQSAILKVQSAYQSNDAKALNSAMKEYDAANKAKLTALNGLLNETNKAVSRAQAQQKIDMASQKQAVTLDISKSTNLGASIAKNIADSGITDKSQISDYVASVAEQYGISNPDILMSAITKAQQTADKTSASIRNTNSEIQKRGSTGGKTSTKGSGTDGTYKYTQSDVDYYSGVLNQGAKTTDGTQYAGRGADGYVDPGVYTIAMKSWVSKGGTPAGFAKKYPVKSNINPASYSQLPAVVQPKAAAPATQYQTTSNAGA